MDSMMTTENLPVLPYNGTAGYSAEGTSRAAAERDADDGTATARQTRILQMLDEAGPLGLTSREVSEATGEHHGRASGTLSNLHKEGLVAALATGEHLPNNSRNGFGVYVLPQNVLGRLTRTHKANRPVVLPGRYQPTAADLEFIDSLRAAVRAGGEQGLRLRASSAQTLLTLIDRLKA
jgi:hypothetical protein